MQQEVFMPPGSTLLHQMGPTIRVNMNCNSTQSVHVYMIEISLDEHADHADLTFCDVVHDLV